MTFQSKNSAKTGASLPILVFYNGTVNWLEYILDDHKIQSINFQKGSQVLLLCTVIVIAWAVIDLDSTYEKLVTSYDCHRTLQDYIHRTRGWVIRGARWQAQLSALWPIPGTWAWFRRMDLEACQRRFPEPTTSLRDLYPLLALIWLA